MTPIRNEDVLDLEALPPDLRDLTLLGQNWLVCRLRRWGRALRPQTNSGAWVDARVASQQRSIPRPGDCSLAAERNRTFHLLIKPDNLTCYQHEPLISLVNQRCRLQRVFVAFPRHIPVSEPMQFVVDKRDQLSQRLLFAAAPGFQQARDAVGRR